MVRLKARQSVQSTGLPTVLQTATPTVRLKVQRMGLPTALRLGSPSGSGSGQP